MATLICQSYLCHMIQQEVSTQHLNTCKAAKVLKDYW